MARFSSLYALLAILLPKSQSRTGCLCRTTLSIAGLPHSPSAPIVHRSRAEHRSSSQDLRAHTFARLRQRRARVRSPSVPPRYTKYFLHDHAARQWSDRTKHQLAGDVAATTFIFVELDIQSGRSVSSAGQRIDLLSARSTCPPMARTTTCVITGYFEYLPASSAQAIPATSSQYSDAHRRRPFRARRSNLQHRRCGRRWQDTPLPTNMAVTKVASVTSTDPVTGASHGALHHHDHQQRPEQDAYRGSSSKTSCRCPTSSMPLTINYVSGTCAILVGSGNAPGGSTCFRPGAERQQLGHRQLVEPHSISCDQATPPGTAGCSEPGDSIILHSIIDHLRRHPASGCVLRSTGNYLIDSGACRLSTRPAQPPRSAGRQPSQQHHDHEHAAQRSTCRRPEFRQHDPPGEEDTDQRSPGGRLAFPSAAAPSTTRSHAAGISLDHPDINNIKLIDANRVLGDIVQAGIETQPFTARARLVDMPVHGL